MESGWKGLPFSLHSTYPKSWKPGFRAAHADNTFHRQITDVEIAQTVTQGIGHIFTDADGAITGLGLWSLLHHGLLGVDSVLRDRQGFCIEVDVSPTQCRHFASA